MSRAPLLPVPLLLLAACGDPSLRSVCRDSGDCAAGQVCEAGLCVPYVAPPLPEVPPPPDLSGCEAPCGTVCCGEGTECRNGACAPVCPSGVFCGPAFAEVCCPTGMVCGRGDRCVLPAGGEPGCPGDGSTWDPGLQTCFPPIEPRACHKPDGEQHVETLWHDSGAGGYDQVIVSPIVIDLNGDGSAEVVAPFYSREQGFDRPAMLRALSGADGTELWRVPASTSSVTGTSQLAAAVLWPGGPVVVVGQDADLRISAFDGRTGERLWRSHHEDGSAVACDLGWGAPAVADLDGDAYGEVVCGFTVIGHDGVVEWTEPGGSGPLGPMIALADLTGDGRLDLTDGTRARRHDGALLWEHDLVGGIPAVADLVNGRGEPSPDGWPEVIVTRGGSLEIRDPLSGFQVVPPILLPTWDGFACYPHVSPPGVGGPPAIADLDGDGRAEVVVASGECLAAMGIVITEGLAQWRMYWGEHAIDRSSAVTGVTLFDLDGDELPDVVHASEVQLHLLQGSHGAPLHHGPHCSGTLYEEPVVADVDGDGSANIVLARNDVGASSLGCPDGVSPGITVLRERRSLWSNARALFNQHGYTGTNVCDGEDALCEALGPLYGAHGALPQDTPRVWTWRPPGQGRAWNSVRRNLGGPWPARGAANARIQAVSEERLSGGGRRLRVRVVNDGEAPLRARTRVDAWARGGRVRYDTAWLPGPLLPLHGVTLSLRVPDRAACGGDCAISVLADAEDRTGECDEGDNAYGPLP